MASTSAQAVFDEIAEHISKQGGPAASWYAGVTGDPQQRVFRDHGVPRENHWWIHRSAASSEAARAVEKALIDLGCDGGGGGGDNSAVHVYAYLKSQKTSP